MTQERDANGKFKSYKVMYEQKCAECESLERQLKEKDEELSQARENAFIERSVHNRIHQEMLKHIGKFRRWLWYLSHAEK